MPSPDWSLNDSSTSMKAGSTSSVPATYAPRETGVRQVAKTGPDTIGSCCRPETAHLAINVDVTPRTTEAVPRSSRLIVSRSVAQYARTATNPATVAADHT